MCKDITIRVISSFDRVFEPKPRILQKINNPSYPKFIPVHEKCIVLFQKIDNIDVLLLVLYVEEFNDKCPQPNTRRTYISYLDSVKFLTPSFYRTRVYQEILVAYMDYCKRLGYCATHIWACPPLGGDDYILHIHPPEQKIPRDDRLRKWYESMIEKGKMIGSVISRNTFYDEFLNQKKYKRQQSRYQLSNLPYFEGDYWTMEIEARMKKKQEKIQKKSDNIYERPNQKSKNRKNISPGEVNAKSQIDPLFLELSSGMASQKDNHLLAHLQYNCTMCGEYILSTYMYICKDCNTDIYVLCENCINQYSSLSEREKHCHSLIKENTSIPKTIDDPDPLMSAPFFDFRREFLYFCLVHHYQYDQVENKIKTS